MVHAAPSYALLGGFATGARVALLWQHNANFSYKLASIPRYDDIVRTAGWAGLAGGRRGRPQNRAPHTGSGRGRPAGDRQPTGGVLNITAAVWNAGFHWWRSGNKKRTQNVSAYMLVLALCLVFCFVIRLSVLLCLLAVITVCCIAKSYHIIHRFIVHRLQ